MEEKSASSLPKRVVRTITLTQEDLSLLDGIERVMARTGLRIKTDSKLIRAAIQVAHASLQDESRSEERRVGKECRSRWSPYH